MGTTKRVITALLFTLAVFAGTAKAQGCEECTPFMGGFGIADACASVVFVPIPANTRAGRCKAPPLCQTPDKSCEFSYTLTVIITQPCFVLTRGIICTVDKFGVPIPPCAITPDSTVTGNFSQTFTDYPVRCGRSETFEVESALTRAILGQVTLSCSFCP